MITVDKLSYDELQFETWKVLTRWMIQKFDILFVQNYIDEALIEIADRQNTGQLPARIFNENAQPRIIRSKGKKRQLIDSKLKITDIAKSYGLEVSRGKCICPFHYDNDPSLSFNDEKNIFHCFGCNAKGDIVEFYRMMEEVKHGQKTS